MLLNDYYIKMQEYSISQLRQNPDYLLFCKYIGNDYNNLQKVSEYLLDMANIDKAEGKYLDYIGWLVGTTRSYFNLARFFSVNNDDVNAVKYFWFKNQTIGQTTDLSDELFRRRIYAKIGYNMTKGTRENNIYIIKNMSFADKVLIEKVEPMVLDITLIGDNIIQTDTLLDDVTDILGTGVGIRHLNIQGATDGQTNEANELAA